jgi:O-antigen/teichoic acid export membrane protein
VRKPGIGAVWRGSTPRLVGGMVVVGASGYAFLAVSARTLHASSDAAAVASLYFLVNTVSLGLFIGLEQETNRAVSAALAGSEGAGGVPAVLRRSLRQGAVLLGIAVLFLGAFALPLESRTLRGHWELLAATAVGALSAYAVYVVRGLLGGTRRFGGYALTLVVEGCARLFPTIAIAAAGYSSPGAYGFIYAFGQLFAAAVGVAVLVKRGLAPALDAAASAAPQAARPEPGARSSEGLAMLVVAGLLTQAVANLAPLAVNSRLPADPALATAFAQACVLVRIPLLLGGPIQAMLLPVFSAAAVRRDLGAIRRRLAVMGAAVGGLGLAGVAASALAGPWVLRAFFAVHIGFSGTRLGALAVGSLLLLLANVVQPALVGLGRHRWVTAAWVSGTAVTGALLAMPIAPVTAGIWASLGGGISVLSVMTVGLRPLARRAATESGSERVSQAESEGLMKLPAQ